MAIKVYVHKAFRESMDAATMGKLVADFRQYKETGVAPSDWGKDVPYNFPPTVAMSGLRHLHVKDATSRNWHIKKIEHRTSDTALVYCESYFNKDIFLLIALFSNAHALVRENLLYLLKLSDIADDFRKKF